MYSVFLRLEKIKCMFFLSCLIIQGFLTPRRLGIFGGVCVCVRRVFYYILTDITHPEILVMLEDCDSNDECAGNDLVCGTNNCHDVTYGGVSAHTQERLRRTTTNWVSDSYCQYGNFFFL